MKLFLTVLFAFVAVSHARIYLDVDVFNQILPPLQNIVYNGGDPPTPGLYTWYNPFSTVDLPQFVYQDCFNCIGGQRDIILGHQTDSPSYATAIASVVGNSGSVAFPLEYAGGAYYQWDGDDTGGDTNAAFPGITLNRSPGLNGDDTPTDFTFGGRGLGLVLTVETDHTVNYYIDAVDIDGEITTFPFEVQETPSRTFFFAFSDPVWNQASDLYAYMYPGQSNEYTNTFTWTRVAGIQVRIFTFSSSVYGQEEQAVDTEFRFLRVVGYEVTGRVVLDCLCDNNDLQPVEGEQIDLYNRGSPTPFASVNTATDGTYIFDVQILSDGDYTVCINNLNQQICPSTTNCIDFTLANFIDATELNFFYTATTSLQLPPDHTGECGSCRTPSTTDPNCPGFATATGCSGSVIITTFSDSSSFSQNGCVETISRTWTDSDTGASGIQTIVLSDTLAPVITQGASDVNIDCASPSTYNTFISTAGGAQANDCTSFVFTPSANSQPIRCGFETVTFTVSDPCFNTDTTTATYTVSDSAAPVYTTAPVDETAECNLKTGSSQTTFNQWLSLNGRSVVTDNCASSGQLQRTNDFTSFPPANGCQQSVVVTFSVNDGCGNNAAASARFTIQDTTPPTISPAAQDASTPCSTNGGDNSAFEAWLANNGGARATDLCIANDANLVWSNDYTGGVVGGANTCEEGIFVTFQVTDTCGQSSVTSATYTIEDTQRPVITTQASADSAQCDGSGTVPEYDAWLANNGGAIATDNCSSASFSNNSSGPPTSCGDTRTVTFSAFDSCGNGPSTTTAVYTLRDDTPPTFNPLPASSSAECSPSASSQFDAWLASNAGASASDDCSNVGLTINNDFQGTTLQPGCNNIATVRFFASDACGNTSPAQTATFTISDNIDPVITVSAQDETVECNLATNQQAYTTFRNNRAGAMATDSCGTISWSNNGPANISPGCDVEQEITWTANDGCGNTAATTATFRIIDTTVPVLTNEAEDLTVDCNGNGNTNDLNNWLTTRGSATATDNCGPVNWSNDFTALSGGCTSTATVTFTGCDPCSQCVFTTATFTIVDNSSPIISPEAQQRIVECDPSSNDNAFDTWVADNGGARATDVCEDDADLVWSSSFQQSPFGCDSEIVTFTVSDLCGRSATTTATFTIIDSVVPTISVSPTNESVECDGTGNTAEYALFLQNRAGAQATDVCAFSLTWPHNGASAGPVGCGREVVTFTVEDECANSNSVTATFTVVDTVGPAITTPASPRSVECAGQSANLAAVQTWLDENGNASAFDSCYNSNFVWSNNFSALSFDGCESFADVTFRATDPCGQFSTTSARFTVVDTRSPTITAVATTEVFECDDVLNPGQISQYVARNGGATATDVCSNVVWSNDFSNGPEECGPSISITFTAADGCGNVARTVGTISIDDNVAPAFVNFPADIVVGCDQDTLPETTGTPSAFDACDADITPTFTDVEFLEPDDGFCPGDLITIRTWSLVDDCGNSVSQEQVITFVFARSTGPCTPTQCPPCELTECCAVVPERVACNTVPCNSVPCLASPCTGVPCIPNGECQTEVPIFDDDDVVGPAPVTPVTPLDCEPVYIYVFDDDDTVIGGGDNGNVDFESESSASIKFFSSMLLLVVLAMLI